MMYNVSIVCQRFSNERWGGGGGKRPEPPFKVCILIIS